MKNIKSNRPAKESEGSRRSQTRRRPEPPPAELTFTVTKAGDRLASFGIQPGDDIHAELIGKPRPGELVVLYMGDDRDSVTGSFVSRDRRTLTVNSGDGPRTVHRSEVRGIYRVTSFTREISGAPIHDGRAKEHAHQARLAELRDRLLELDPDDITNSTAAFRLEKEIHDLERAASADEWPEYIAA